MLAQLLGQASEGAVEATSDNLDMDDHLEPQILDRVRDLVARVLRIDVDRIKVDTPIIAELGAESIDLLELRFFLEKAFKVKIADAELHDSMARFTNEDRVDEFCAGMITRDIQERLKRKEQK